MTDYNRELDDVSNTDPFSEVGEDATAYESYVKDCKQEKSADVIHLNCNEGVIEEHPLIPPGEYKLRYIDHELHKNYHGYGNKLVICFEIYKGKFREVIIEKFYNVEINKHGGFTVRGGTSYCREMRLLFPEKKGFRRDRLPPSLLKNKTILASVRTVVTGKKNRERLLDEQYSVVDKLLRVV